MSNFAGVNNQVSTKIRTFYITDKYCLIVNKVQFISIKYKQAKMSNDLTVIFVMLTYYTLVSEQTAFTYISGMIPCICSLKGSRHSADKDFFVRVRNRVIGEISVKCVKCSQWYNSKAVTFFPRESEVVDCIIYRMALVQGNPGASILA